MSDQPFRPLSLFERALLERLIETLRSDDELVSRQLVGQLDQCLVRSLDEHGCIEFNIASESGSPPVCEGEAEDADGTLIHVLLFLTNDGSLYTLEIMRDDDTPIIKLPEPAEFRVWRRP